MNCGGATKPGTIKILQYGLTALGALENADHQNAIAILPPKSHTKPYKIYRLANIDAIVQLWLQETAPAEEATGSKSELQAGLCTRSCARMRISLLRRKRDPDREKARFP